VIGCPFAPRQTVVNSRLWHKSRKREGSHVTNYSEIPGFPGYTVSSDGRIFSTKWGYPRERKQVSQTRGHKLVILRDPNGSPKGFYVHRLVAQAFVPKPDPSFNLVRHLDDDPSNNDVSNLAWGTQTDNLRDAVRNEKIKTSLKGLQVVQARGMIAQGLEYYSIGKHFGVPTHVIADLATRTRKEV
jgi:hypothetical protein